MKQIMGIMQYKWIIHNDHGKLYKPINILQQRTMAIWGNNLNVVIMIKMVTWLINVSTCMDFQLRTYKAQASTPQPFKDSPQNRQHSQLKNITRSCPYWKKKMVITNPLYVNMSTMIAHSCHSAQQYPMKYVGLWTVVQLTISSSRHQYTMRSIIVIMWTCLMVTRPK